MRGALLVVLLGWPVEVGAQADGALRSLMRATSLRCEFDHGSQGSWENGHAKVEPVRFGNDNTIIFDAISPKQLTARLIGNQGAGDVKILPTLAGLTFIETASAGSVNLTTVFGIYRDGTTNEFVAVQSRHVATLVGPPLPSQYLGTCRVWQ